jgi:hypothetical protein
VTADTWRFALAEDQAAPNVDVLTPQMQDALSFHYSSLPSAFWSASLREAFSNSESSNRAMKSVFITDKLAAIQRAPRAAARKD